MAQKNGRPNSNILFRIFRFYAEGFQKMTVGKTLWTIILIKLFILFAVLKLFLFPDFLSSKGGTDDKKADYVRNEIIRRN